MEGYKYDISMYQFDDHGVLHPDAQILFMLMQEKHPYVITSIMTQLLLKAELKEWVTKAHNNLNSYMKQLGRYI